MKVSITIPIWNRAAYLQYSLYLYAKQTIKDFEIIVIDDNSDDNPYDVCKIFKDHMNIRFFRCGRKEDQSLPQGCGPLLNFAAKNVAKGEITIYADPEVMPFPDFVEQHYLSHQPGHIIKEPDFIAPGVPGKIRNPIAIEMETYYNIKGLTLKTWIEHRNLFGTLEGWMKEGRIKDIVSMWNWMWSIIMKLPNDHTGEHNKDSSYRNGDQSFWGFQGSQAGWSYRTDKYVELRGWNEDCSKLGYWMAEDCEFGARMRRAGIQSIENANIRAIHLCHPKATIGSDEMIDNCVRDPYERNEDCIIGNVGHKWGDPEILKIEEIKL